MTSISVCITVVPDCDGDGMPDSWEERYTEQPEPCDKCSELESVLSTPPVGREGAGIQKSVSHADLWQSSFICLVTTAFWSVSSLPDPVVLIPQPEKDMFKKQFDFLQVVFDLLIMSAIVSPFLFTCHEGWECGGSI